MRNVILAAALFGALSTTPPGHAQDRGGDVPPYGCKTQAAYNEAIDSAKAGDRDRFDGLLASGDCLLINGRKFSLIQTNFLKLNATIRLTTESGDVVLFTGLDTIPAM